MDAIIDICRRRNLVLIEDSCEALGASYDGKPVGKFGRVATFSFYYSHHITTLEGGICVTDDDELAETMRILRAHGWVREVEDKQRWLSRYPDIDPKFLFVNVGYNLRATEPQGAMGSVQLKKLDRFVEMRRASAAAYRKALQRFGNHFAFQEETPKGRHSWFGFSLIVREGAAFGARDLMAALGRANIETRPIIAGNIARQPALKHYAHRTVGDLGHSTAVMQRGFSFGNHQAIDDAARAYVVEHVAKFVNERG
jgi:CDP-6-deoxy-D-xylo-4-hexulose-3-dehydrase